VSDIEGPTVKINADASGVDSAIQHVTHQFETLQTQAAGIGGKFEALGASMSSIGAGLTAGITAPMTVAVASIGAMTQQAANFQSQMAEVFTLMPGLGKEAMGQMSDDVKAFSSEFGIMSEQVVPALYQAISAGVPSDNVFSFLEVAAKSSIGGVTDLETAVDGLTTVMNSYTNDQVSAERAADAMFTAVKLGKTNFEELSQSMYQATPMANALGISIEDVAAAFATLTAQGTPTNVSATQMKALFKELLDPASELSKYLDEVTEGADFKQLSDSGKSLFDIISILNNGLKEDGKQWTEVTGSIEASQAGMVLSSEMMGNFTNQMKDASGAVDEAYKTMSDTAVQQMNKVKAELHNMVIDIGESFLPILQNDIMPILKDDLVPYIQNTVVPTIKGFADWFSNLDGEGKKAAAGVGIFAAALGPLMMVLGPFVSAGGSLVSTLASIGKIAQTTTAATGVTTLVSSLAQLEKINPTPALQYIAPIGPAASGAASQVGLLSSALVAVGPALIVGAGAVAGAFVAYQTNFADFRTNVDNAIEHVNNAANLIDRGQYQQAGRELANAVGDGFATAKDLIVKGIPDAAVFAYELDSQMRVAIGDMSGGFGAALREMVDGALASAGAAFEQFAINDAAFAKSFSESLRNGDWEGAAADAAGKFKDSFYTNGKIDAGKLLDGVDSLTSKLQPALDMITLISNPFGGAASVLGGESGNILDGYFNPEKYKKTSDEIEKFERAVAKSLQNAGTEVKTFADKSSADLNNAMSKWQDAFEKSGQSLEKWTESLKKSGDYSQFISDMDAFAAKYPELAEKAGGAANVMQQLDFKPVQFEDGSIFYAYENGVLTPIIDNPVKIMMELNDYENDMRSAYEIYLDYKSQIENAPIMVQMMGPDVSTLSPDTQWISNEGGGTGKNINDVRGTQTTPDNKTVNQNTDAQNKNTESNTKNTEQVSALYKKFSDWDTYQSQYMLQNKGASVDTALAAYNNDKRIASQSSSGSQPSQSDNTKATSDNTTATRKSTEAKTDEQKALERLKSKYETLFESMDQYYIRKETDANVRNINSKYDSSSDISKSLKDNQKYSEVEAEKERGQLKLWASELGISTDELIKLYNEHKKQSESVTQLTKTTDGANDTLSKIAKLDISNLVNFNLSKSSQSRSGSGSPLTDAELTAIMRGRVPYASDSEFNTLVSSQGGIKQYAKNAEVIDNFGRLISDYTNDIEQSTKTTQSVIYDLSAEIRKYNRTVTTSTKQSSEMENSVRLASAAQSLYTKYMDDGILTTDEASKIQSTLTESTKSLGDAGIKTVGDISKLPPALQDIATALITFISNLKSSAVDALNSSLASDGWKTATSSSYESMIDPKTGKPVQRSYLDIDVILGLKEGSAKVDSLTEANTRLQDSIYSNVGTTNLLSSAYQAAGNAAVETMNKVVNVAADKIAQANSAINSLSYSNSGNSISASNYMPGMTYSGNRQMFEGFRPGWRNPSPCGWGSAFESGGKVTETGPALVHEGEYILSRNEVERMGKGGANIQLNVNMNNSRFGNAEIAKDLPKLFARAARRAYFARGSI
jgi:TP901 family phage tail tape measure protein